MKIHIFYLKYTDNNKYVVESPSWFIIRKLLSIRIEREKCVKSFATCLKHVFWPKIQFFTQISERSPCTYLHHSDLDSGGKRYLEMTKNSLHTPKLRVGGIPLGYKIIMININLMLSYVLQGFAVFGKLWILKWLLFIHSQTPTEVGQPCYDCHQSQPF